MAKDRPNLDAIDREAIDLFYKDLEPRPIIVTTMKVLRELFESQIVFSGESIGSLRLHLRLELLNEERGEQEIKDIETAKNYIFSLQANNVITTCTTARQLWDILQTELRELTPIRRRVEKK